MKLLKEGKVVRTRTNENGDTILKLHRYPVEVKVLNPQLRVASGDKVKILKEPGDTNYIIRVEPGPQKTL